MDEELWSIVPDFPRYAVSTRGQVLNRETDRLMRLSQTTHGHMKVSLVANGRRYTRSVALLVAEAYLDQPDPLSDHVLVLDGDLTYVAVDNLAWRPAYFCWRYTRQLKLDQPEKYMNLSVLNVHTNIYYESIVEAGMTEGVLFEDIWRSTYSGSLVYPIMCAFEICERV